MCQDIATALPSWWIHLEESFAADLGFFPGLVMLALGKISADSPIPGHILQSVAGQ